MSVKNSSWKRSEANSMERVNKIIRHPRFCGELDRLHEIEKDRAFCGHGMGHLLDVARIAYILCLESNESCEKELIYAAAMLHDVGRARQYEDGTPHEKESAAIAAEILPECGFSGPETDLILEAILAHRTRSGSGGGGLSALLYRADKLSRMCFAGVDKQERRRFDCAAIDECYWELKNQALVY